MVSSPSRPFSIFAICAHGRRFKTLKLRKCLLASSCTMSCCTDREAAKGLNGLAPRGWRDRARGPVAALASPPHSVPQQRALPTISFCRPDRRPIAHRARGHLASSLAGTARSSQKIDAFDYLGGPASRWQSASCYSRLRTQFKAAQVASEVWRRAVDAEGIRHGIRERAARARTTLFKRSNRKSSKSLTNRKNKWPRKEPGRTFKSPYY